MLLCEAFGTNNARAISPCQATSYEEKLATEVAAAQAWAQLKDTRERETEVDRILLSRAKTCQDLPRSKVPRVLLSIIVSIS